MKDKLKLTAGAIPFSFLWLLAFYLIYIAAGFLLVLILTFLHSIPVIKSMINMLFYLRGDTPLAMSLLISAIVAYYAVTKLADKLVKKTYTKCLSLRCAGIYIAVLNVVFIIINLICKNYIFGNIVAIGASIAFILNNKPDFPCQEEETL